MTPFHIVADMQDSGTDPHLCVQLLGLAIHDPGVRDLLQMWAEAPEFGRGEILADLYELVEDHDGSTDIPSFSRGDQDAMASYRRAFKARLRALVKVHGGVSEVARRAGIPQPSLSRMLNSMAEPRANTLQRLADAMGIEAATLVHGARPRGRVEVLRQDLVVRREVRAARVPKRDRSALRSSISHRGAQT